MAERDFNRATGKTATEDAKRRALRMVKEKQFFEDKSGEYLDKIHSEQTHDRLDLDRGHDRQKSQLQDKLCDTYGAQKSNTQNDLKALKAQSEKSKLSQQERDRAKALQKNLENIRQREKEQQDALKARQATQKQTLDDKHKAQTERAERAVQSAKQERQASGWKPAPVMFDQHAGKDSAISFQKPAQGTGSSQGKETFAENSSDAPRPYLAPKGARTGNLNPEGQKMAGQSAASKSAGKGMGL